MKEAEMLEDSEKRIAWLLCGPSGSGKTTAREAILADFPNAVVASSDDYIMAMCEGYSISYQEAYRRFADLGEKSMWDRIDLAIDRFRDLVVDRTNLSMKRREPIIEKISETHRVIAVVPDFDVTSEEGLSTLLERRISRRDRGEEALPEFAIRAHVEAWCPPEMSEGFSDITPCASLLPSGEEAPAPI